MPPRKPERKSKPPNRTPQSAGSQPRSSCLEPKFALSSFFSLSLLLSIRSIFQTAARQHSTSLRKPHALPWGHLHRHLLILLGRTPICSVASLFGPQTGLIRHAIKSECDRQLDPGFETHFGCFLKQERIVLQDGGAQLHHISYTNIGSITVPSSQEPQLPPPPCPS